MDMAGSAAQRLGPRRLPGNEREQQQRDCHQEAMERAHAKKHWSGHGPIM